MTSTSKLSIMTVALGLTLSACNTAGTSPATSANTPATPVAENTVDKRAGLKAGFRDAESVISNLEHLHNLPSPAGFSNTDNFWSPARQAELRKAIDDGEEVDEQPAPISFANSDLAFKGNHVIMGNFHGFNVVEIADNGAPTNVLSVACPGGQGDVTVHGDLVFYSVEQNRGRIDCGSGGEADGVSAERFRGIRIFDISDMSAPRQVAAIQTCRGSHTHTLVPHPSDDNTLYIYNSGTAGVRSDEELQGCSDGEPDENPDTALYSIDVIKVSLDAPENAAIVNRPRIFADPDTGKVNGLWNGGAIEDGAQETSQTVACHDITAYPSFNLAAGACAGNGILLDISDPENPTRIDEIADTNMAYWHSATFSNDAKKILFTDEWGGGIAARCRAEDPETWGADLVADLTENGMVARGFFKIPGVQSENENCVAHNGSLIPVPGRDIMVQGWYSGGLSIVDFTDSQNPYEIAYFDRGPLSDEDLYLGGFWAAYWHNGRIYAPEIMRGLDIFRLIPSEHLSAAEIAAAEQVILEEANTQTQIRYEWGNNPTVAQAYLDQLVRAGAVENGLMDRLSREIKRWKDGNIRPKRLKELAGDLKAATANASQQDTRRLLALTAVFERAR